MLGPSEKTLRIFNFSHFILPMVILHMNGLCKEELYLFRFIFQLSSAKTGLEWQF